MTDKRQRILQLVFILIAMLWTAHVLLAQPQSLPQIPFPQISQNPMSQVQQHHVQQPQTPLPQTPLPQTPLPQTPLPQTPLPQIPFPQIQPNFPQQTPLPQIQLQSAQRPQADANGLTIALTRTAPDKLEQVLRQVCGHRFSAQAQNQYMFLSNRENVIRQCLLRIEPQTREAVLTGDPLLADEVSAVITAIDLPPQRGKERQIYPYQHVHPEVLNHALEAYRFQRPMAQNGNPNAIRQVQFEGGAFDAGMIMQGGVSPFFAQGDPAAIGFVDDIFKFQIVTGLDVVIIEAEGNRLKQFIEMIRQLEELSKINRPRIEVVYLQHVSNISLGNIFTQENSAIYVQIFQTVQGTVRILPMSSPNAIMLLGWGDSMDVAKEFIKALDVPIAAENPRLTVFRLKHISVNQARTVLQGAFPPPPVMSGFAPRITHIGDQRTNVLIVQAAPNDLIEVQQIIKDIDVPGSDVILQVKPFMIKNSLAPDMATTLQGVLASGTSDGKSPSLELLIQGEEGQRLFQSGILTDVNISTDPRNNIVIVRAPKDCMEFIKALIETLDVSSPQVEIKIFKIDFADAESLITMLRTLIPSNIEGVAGPALPSTDQGEALLPIRFAVDARTNSIIAAGSPGDLLTVEALINSLDREDSLTRENTVYFLKNMKAMPVAATITAFITQKLQIQSAAGGVISAFEQLESALIVVPDEESNSLIISAAPKYFDEIMKLIEEIDKSQPQVVINVLIAEVTLTEDKEWAAELGLQDPLMFTQRGGNLLFNSGKGENALGTGTGAPETVGTQILSNFGAGRVGDVGFGGLIFSASSEYLNVMIRALQSKNRLEVLSSPQIMTMNNQQAIISVGQVVPRYKGTTTYQNSTTQQNIDDTEVVLMLTITPTISPEGTIVMGVVLRKEKLGAPVGDLGNTIDKANLGTMVCAANNETVVLGGLITKEESKLRKKIPLLGDIPLLGKMFRHEIDRTERKELLVILTPRIINSPDEREQVKHIEYARMSWCLNNVVQTHGDIGAYSVVSPSPYTGNVPVITPGPVKIESLEPLFAPELPTPTLPRR